MKNGQLTRLPRRRIFRAYQLSGFRLNQRTGACSVGESEFMGSKAPSGRGVHNFGNGLSPLLRRLDARTALVYKNKMATHPQVSRWQNDRPPSLQQFMASFPDDDLCADWLQRRRWPDGFVCPRCHARKGWKLETKPWTFECAACGKQTSVTAGTIMHGTHLPLRPCCTEASKGATAPSWNHLRNADEIGLPEFARIPSP